jgi:hypothetical protein
MFKIAPQLAKYLREVKSAVLNRRFEFAPNGLYLPAMKVMLSPRFIEWPGNPFSVEDRALAGVWPNLVVDEGKIYLISVGLLTGSQITLANWFMAIHSGATPPAANWDGANYATNASEITATSPEGYSEANRQGWSGVANTGNTSADNSASPAQVTIVTASQLTVRGAALIGGDNVRGGTTGTLMGAVQYGADRLLGNGDTYNIQYEFDLVTP